MPKVSVYFEKRDIWLGMYWDYQTRSRMWWLKVYVCLIPCVPIRLTWQNF